MKTAHTNAPSATPRLRRAVTIIVGTLGVTAATAGPAAAGVPVGWGSNDDGMSIGWLIALLVGFPLAATIVISLLTLLPGVMRGEGLIPTKAVPAADATPELESSSH